MVLSDGKTKKQCHKIYMRRHRSLMKADCKVPYFNKPASFFTNENMIVIKDLYYQENLKRNLVMIKLLCYYQLDQEI